MKRLLTVTLALLATLALALAPAGCGNGRGTSDGSSPQGTATSAHEPVAATVAARDEGSSGATGSQAVATYSDALQVAYDKSDLDTSWNQTTSSFITLADGAIRFDGAGAEVAGNRVTIKQAGTYVVNGTVSDGQIVVDCKETGLVRLVLNGASITCASSAPLYVKSAHKVILILAESTENLLADGASYVLDDADSDEPNAAIFSRADLTINGLGSLSVMANYNDGVTSKDDLKIVSGDITIEAVNDAVKGKDCLGIKEPSLTIVAGGDGLQSTNDSDAAKGFIAVSGGALDITAAADGIQAETTLLISGGDLVLVTGGGSSNAPARTEEFGAPAGGWGQGQMPGGGRGATTTDTTEVTDTTETAEATGATTGEGDSDSAKGLKAGGGLFIDGGAITVDSSDDAVHSNNAITIGGGTLSIASGDDGIHADASVTINGGVIDITTCYEGIESALVTINEGAITLVACDDGINIAGGDDAASAAGTRGNDFTPNENNSLRITGGTISVDARGDGVDSNGWISMSGGTLLINGPVSNGNGAIDYLGEWTVTAGLVVAVGSSGMAQAPSTSSSQYSIMVGFSQVQAAGTLIRVADESGADMLTFTPTKEYQSLVFSSPELREGATYAVYVGGTEYTSLAISGMVTTSGTTGGMMPGGMQGGRPQGAGSQSPRDGATGTTSPTF